MKRKEQQPVGILWNSPLPAGQVYTAFVSLLQRRRRRVIVWAVVVIIAAIICRFHMPILKRLYGLHEARVETKQSVLAVADRYELDRANIVTVAPESFSALFGKFGNSIPEILVFDRQGRYVEYKATEKSCNAGAFGFIAHLDRDRLYNPGGKTNLNVTMSALRDMNGNELPAGYLNAQADFYVFISWASYAGRLNKDHVAQWELIAAGNHAANIQVVAVNFDVQQHWPAAARDSLLRSHRTGF